jgi:hypothetical protein
VWAIAAEKETTSQRLARAAKARSLEGRVKPWIDHARRFGDPRSVFETAEREGLPARELGYFAAQLRRVTAIQKNAGYWSTTAGGTRQWVLWPKFELTPSERDPLARRLLAAGVEHKTVAVYVGVSVSWVRRLDEDTRGDRQVARLLEQHGPVDLLESSLDPGVQSAFLSALDGREAASAGDSSSSPSQACPTSINKGDASVIPAPGQRFGRLVIESFDRDEKRNRLAHVRCDCGGTLTVRVSDLVRGKAKSCGCLKRELVAEMQARAAKRAA